MVSKKPVVSKKYIFLIYIILSSLAFILMTTFSKRYVTEDEEDECGLPRDSSAEWVLLQKQRAARNSANGQADPEEISSTDKCNIWMPFFPMKSMCRQGTFSPNDKCVPHLMWLPMICGIAGLILFIISIAVIFIFE